MIRTTPLRSERELVDVATLARPIPGAPARALVHAVPERLPLLPPKIDPTPYPVKALGAVLGNAAQGIARKIQVPPAMAAQSVLAVATLAAQAHRDVRLPFGQVRPLSSFFVTVAGSGDRKSSADSEALWPIAKHERALRDDYRVEIKDWDIRKAAHAAQRKKIEADKGLDLSQRETELRALGGEPPEPLSPALIAPDPTIEGLMKYWINAPASLGIFSAEGGQFFGGHAMNQDNRLKTAAALSEIWDGKAMRRMRAGDGLTILNGRRLACHLMAQPDAAAAFLSDPLLRDQGLVSRVLVAAPDSLAGSRFYRDPLPQDEAAIRAYGARILALLERPAPLAGCSRNELDPPVLDMTPAAAAAWREFFDHVEKQCGRGGEYEGIRAFTSKASEHVARIAGVLTLVEDAAAAEIDEATMNNAIELIDWYIAETLRLTECARTSPALDKAQRLAEWIKAQGKTSATMREIMQFGPNDLRMKDEAERAAGTLSAHGWAILDTGRPRTLTLTPEEV